LLAIFLQACLYAVSTYNNCLGNAITRAEDAAEDRQASSPAPAAVAVPAAATLYDGTLHALGLKV
jgi:hypothetical protein